VKDVAKLSDRMWVKEWEESMKASLLVAWETECIKAINEGGEIVGKDFMCLGKIANCNGAQRSGFGFQSLPDSTLETLDSE
jgi:hypothetical protein